MSLKHGIAFCLFKELKILLWEVQPLKQNTSYPEILDTELAGLGETSVVIVSKWRPITRKQFEAASELWPTHFHEDKM